MKNKLIEKINNKSATIAIIGLGYVGLPLVIRFIEEKFKVIGFDIDSDKCSTLKSGKSYIRHISAESIQLALKNGFTATTNWRKIAEVDCMLICVPTPLGASPHVLLNLLVKSIPICLNGFLKKEKLGFEIEV